MGERVDSQLKVLSFSTNNELKVKDVTHCFFFYFYLIYKTKKNIGVLTGLQINCSFLEKKKKIKTNPNTKCHTIFM